MGYRLHLNLSPRGLHSSTGVNDAVPTCLHWHQNEGEPIHHDSLHRICSPLRRRQRNRQTRFLAICSVTRWPPRIARTRRPDIRHIEAMLGHAKPHDNGNRHSSVQDPKTASDLRADSEPWAPESKMAHAALRFVHFKRSSFAANEARHY